MIYRKEYDLKAVGRNIRAVRRDRHISVEQVREHLMLESTETVYRWERGIMLPQADTLIALCVYLDVDPLKIFSEAVEEPENRYLTYEQAYSKQRVAG